jgi:hypothetical protein
MLYSSSIVIVKIKILLTVNNSFAEGFIRSAKVNPKATATL